jgi:acyl-CoA thioesterase-1
VLSEKRAADQDAGWPSLVVGPPPIANSTQNERIADLDAAFSSVCGDAGVGYARVFEQLSADPVWMRQVAEDDGAHPGARGYQRLADLVWPWWLSWITADIP